jgi:hypothetical protein
LVNKFSLFFGSLWKSKLLNPLIYRFIILIISYRMPHALVTTLAQTVPAEQTHIERLIEFERGILIGWALGTAAELDAASRARLELIGRVAVGAERVGRQQR